MKSFALRVALLTAVATSGSSQTRLDLRTQTRNVDLSNALVTKTVKTGNTLPSTCSAGELFFNISSGATGLYTCAPANTWSPAGLPVGVNHIGHVLTTDGTSPLWQPLTGDVSGGLTAISVQGLQGRAISPAVPSNGQVLSWNSMTASWTPMSVQQSAPNYAKTFSGATLVTILGTEHGQGSPNLIVSCWNGLTPSSWIEPDAVQVDPVTFNVQIAFATAQSGRCVVNGSGGGSGGGGGTGGTGGAVGSVFGRIGTVIAQAGDYAFAQIAGTASVAQMPSGIPASNIGAGTVSNAAFAALANVTSDVQAQLSGKASTTHTHFGGGDLYGDVTNTAVVGLQHFPVSPVAPQSGQALVFNGTTGQWQPQAVAGGSGGASSTAQLSDLGVTFTSPTVLTIGSNCSTTAPCNVRFGTTVFSILSSSNVTLTAPGSGTAYFYVTSDGTVTAGSIALPLACSTNCTALTNVAQFPLNSIPLASWTVLNGQWTSGGGTDRRAFQSTNVVSGGAGIALVDNGTQTTVSVDANLVPTFLTNTASVTFAPIANASCGADQTMTLSGAMVGDSVAPGWPALPAGVMGTMWVSAANTVSLRLCNLSGSAQSPGTVTVRATDVRSF